MKRPAGLGSARIAQLRELLDRALVDAYGEAEQAGSLLVALEEQIRVPARGRFLGRKVEVVGFDLDQGDRLVVVVRQGRAKASVPLYQVDWVGLDETEAAWIEACRLWSRGE